MAYILFVVQTQEEANVMNASFPISDVDYWLAIYCGQRVCGLRHKTQRPNVVVVGYVELTDKDKHWTNEILRPCADYNAVWVTGKYEGKR
ncbi:hypothetical protein MH117_09755 [Paenibacillus sp. ACRRX]|uniref:hypothetical protein n=1 Tax=Paenibacillus sp. ACRRX TaxID=2918206 RepID=UPI001EF74166|nr:hypothetical protein [Paenibacillus sp. ACRRX]MCG7407708.1 hypothetical protein [Paenibacillus sp. ACRRX]